MKIKIIAVLISTLFIVATALPVAGNIVKIDKKDVSNTNTLSDLNLDIAITNAFINKINIFLGNGVGGFTNTGDFNVGAFPVGITDGDFNLDGILDLATTDYEDSNVTLLLGEGTGSFINVGSFPVGSEPLGIIDEDFNKDGNSDIAVANTGSNKISVLLGNGAGGFAPQQTYNIGNGPVDLCYGMFDEDDNLDIMGANLDGNSVALLTGDGTGGFVLSLSIDLGAEYKPYAITKADFNKDGNLDVAIASGKYPYVGVLLGNGTGEFSPLQNFTVEYGFERFDIVSDDFNNDGNPDIAVPNTDNNTVSVLLGDGKGNFGIHMTFDVGAYPVGICKGDFDSDGNCDLAVTNAFDNTISILIGDGAGGFEPQKKYPAGDGPVGIITVNIDYIPEPDLECEGSFNWKKVNPGQDIIDEFSIGNVGVPGSVLNWELESYPTWGTWNFSKTSGYLADGVWEGVQLIVTAPNQPKTEFTGTIKVINSDDPSDYCEIEVVLETPRTKTIFESILFKIFERFPNVFPIIRWILKI